MLDIFTTRRGAILKLVYGCNHHCNFCHERDNILSLEYTMITLEDLPRIRAWLIENQFDYVILSGGECSFHPHLSEIIAELQKDFFVVVISNGTNIDRHNFQELASNVTFYISFHGLSETYNTITHSSDFDALVTKIRTLAKLGRTIILRCVLNRLNIAESALILEFVMREFPANVYLEFVLLEDLKYAHVQETSIPLAEYLRVVYRTLIDTKGERFLFDGGPLCANPVLFKIGNRLADPLTNTMVGLVKKEKNGKLIFDIKTEISKTNVKSRSQKCHICTQRVACHGFDREYIISEKV